MIKQKDLEVKDSSPQGDNLVDLQVKDSSLLSSNSLVSILALLVILTGRNPVNVFVTILSIVILFLSYVYLHKVVFSQDQ